MSQKNKRQKKQPNKRKPPGKKGQRQSRPRTGSLVISRDVYQAIRDKLVLRRDRKTGRPKKQPKKVSASIQRDVLLALSMHVHWDPRVKRPTNEGCVSIRRLAEFCGLSAGTVTLACAALVASGIVRRAPGTTTPRWTLLVHWSSLPGAREDKESEHDAQATMMAVVEGARAMYGSPDPITQSLGDPITQSLGAADGPDHSVTGSGDPGKGRQGTSTTPSDGESITPSCALNPLIVSAGADPNEAGGEDSQGSLPLQTTPGGVTPAAAGTGEARTPTLPPAGAGGGFAPVACGDSPGAAAQPAAAGVLDDLGLDDLEVVKIEAEIEDDSSDGDEHPTEDEDEDGDPPPGGDVDGGPPPDGDEHPTEDEDEDPPPGGEGGPDANGNHLKEDELAAVVNATDDLTADEGEPTPPLTVEEHPQGPRHPRKPRRNAKPTRAPETDLVWKRLVSERRFDAVVRVALVITDGIRRHWEVVPTRGKGYYWVTHIHPPGKPHDGIYRVADLNMEIKAWTWRKLRAELADAERHVTDALSRIGIGEYRPEHLMVACLGFVAAKERQRHGDPLTERILLSGASPILGLKFSDEEAGGCLTDTVRWRSQWCADVWPAMTRELLAQMTDDTSMSKVSAHWAWVEIQRARDAAAE